MQGSTKGMQLARGQDTMDGSEHATAGCVPQVNASIFFSLLMPAAVQQ